MPNCDAPHRMKKEQVMSMSPMIQEMFDEHVAEADVVAPSATEPPSTTVQGATSTKKISAIRGWTKEEMLAAIDDIEFNGYSVRASAKKHTIPPSSIHYWINGLTHTKRRGPVTVMTEEEEAEAVEWCK